MKEILLPLLICPDCKQPDLVLTQEKRAKDEIESGLLSCSGCQREFPIVNFVPRFVPADNYAASFGLQWNRFPTTQFDSTSGTTISHDRFMRETGWKSEDVSGDLVLDAGCGSGRFAEIALSLGAQLVAIDYSSAIDACYANLGSHPNVHLVQANVFELPFRSGTFDRAYSMGVLMATPDPKKALLSVADMVRPEGHLVVDFYLREWRTMLHPKYLLRPLTRRIPPERLFPIVEKLAPPLLSLSRALSRVPLLGRYLSRAVPVANYEGDYPLSDQQLVEWAILDTFDWLSPRFDNPMSPAAVMDIIKGAGFEDLDVTRRDLLTARARIPAAASDQAS